MGSCFPLAFGTWARLSSESVRSDFGQKCTWFYMQRFFFKRLEKKSEERDFREVDKESQTTIRLWKKEVECVTQTGV